MAWFTKKADPISDRARALNEEIAALEEQIRQLDTQLHNDGTHPRLRSTAVPHGPTLTHTATLTQSPPAPPSVAPDPIFEPHAHEPASRVDAEATPDHYNEFGVRKYDAVALVERMGRMFRGPTTSNPKLVHYLSAGSMQGLRPLRYEKRVARNRFILLTSVFFLVLLGIVLMLLKRY